MSPHDDTDRPDPQRLAAYADGELPPAQRRAVEAWLARHPEARDEVEAQRRLARLWQDGGPPEPSEAAWSDVLARVEAALPDAAAAGRVPRRKRSAGLVWLAGLSAAAAVAAAVLLAVAWWQPGEQEPDVATLPVASADDIEIISMDAADIPALVVGEPPVRGPLLLASAADVTVDDTGHDVEVVI